MARRSDPLTDLRIRNAKPREKLYKLFDGNGLYLEVPPRQTKRWRLKYRYGGKEKRVSLGTYPETSLSEARRKATEARKLLEEGIDPAEHKKAVKEEARAKERSIQERKEKSFSKITEEYLDHYREQKAPSYWSKVERAFERDVLPFIGHLPIDEITVNEIIAIARRIEERGARETARRVHSQIGRVFRYAIAHGRAKRNTAQDVDLSMIVKPVETRHYPAITEPEKVGELIRTIRSYTGNPIVRDALIFLALTAVRPGNVREAEWEEIDMEGALWKIPGKKMKAKKDHIVPLSRQAVTLLEDLRSTTGSFKYIFPSPLYLNHPISDGTMNRALRLMGYGGDRFTPHSWRSVFSTIAREVGEFPHAVIEFQLAHKEGGAVSQAYNRATYLPQRRELMQWWADWLEDQ